MDSDSPNNPTSEQSSLGSRRARKAQDQKDINAKLDRSFDLTSATDAEVVEHYTPLVRHLVFDCLDKFPAPKSFIDDMISSGNMGLLEAFSRYDAKHGAAFSTFAYYRIRGCIIDSLRHAGFIRRREQVRAVLNTAHATMQEDACTARPVSTPFRVRGEHIDRSIRTLGAVWLVHHEATEAQREAGERFRPSRRLFEAETRAQIQEAITQLNDMERMVIHEAYYKERTLSDIGREHGYSRSWLCRVHSRAVQKLAVALSNIEEDPKSSGSDP